MGMYKQLNIDNHSSVYANMYIVHTGLSQTIMKQLS